MKLVSVDGWQLQMRQSTEFLVRMAVLKMAIAQQNLSRPNAVSKSAVRLSLGNCFIQLGVSVYEDLQRTLQVSYP
ncbi:MAG: hypothetical protein HC772_09880 [Leptolyngbyaceae cyanobacterium CRU_2_3]|nr:hypothetical protein [Leptolyngbyaceae cyanobacterium CRU_2_3]